MELDLRNLPEKLLQQDFQVYLAIVKELSQNLGPGITTITDNNPDGAVGEDYVSFGLKFPNAAGDLCCDPKTQDVTLRVRQIFEGGNQVVIEHRAEIGEGIRFTFYRGAESAEMLFLSDLTASDSNHPDARSAVNKTREWLRNTLMG